MDDAKRSEYSYSRSVTIRVYGFLVGFAAWALWERSRTDGDVATPGWILAVGVVVAAAYLIFWRNRRLATEFAVMAVGVMVLSPVLQYLAGRVSGQLAGDVLLLGAVALGLLVVFARLPEPAAD